MAPTPSSPLRSVRAIIGFIALAVALALTVPAAAQACAGADANPNNVSADAARSATLCLLNAERRQRGLRGLSHNSRLGLAATRHAQDMVQRNYFAHVSRSGRTMVQRVRAARYLTGRERRWSVGENIAWGSGWRATPRAIVRAWMDSPPHRANILHGRFREIGIGIALGAPVGGMDAAATYGTNFGARG